MKEIEPVKKTTPSNAAKNLEGGDKEAKAKDNSTTATLHQQPPAKNATDAAMHQQPPTPATFK